MKIYVAGPMRGIPGHNHVTFAAVSAELRKHFSVVVSPVEINHLQGAPERTDEECLKRDLAELIGCDGIALLPDWQKSVGARCEVAVAITLGLMFVRVVVCQYEDTDECVGEVTSVKLRWPDDPPPSVMIRGGYQRELLTTKRGRAARILADAKAISSVAATMEQEASELIYESDLEHLQRSGWTEGEWKRNASYIQRPWTHAELGVITQHVYVLPGVDVESKSLHARTGGWIRNRRIFGSVAALFEAER